MNTTLTIEQMDAIMQIVGYSVVGALIALLCFEIIVWLTHKD
jgi:hypothetical protein